MTENGNSPKKKQMVGISIAAAILVIFGALWWWLSVRSIISTDNAKVSGDLVDISPEVSGKLIQLCVMEGQQVQAGQVLARLDDSQYKINLQQAQAALDLAQANYAKLPNDIKSAAANVDKSSFDAASAGAEVESARTALADARRKLDHDKALFASGAISKEDIDTSQSAYDKAESEVEKLKADEQSDQAGLADAQSKLDSLNNAQAAVYLAQIKQAQATYDNAKRAEDNTTIIAGIKGTILRVPVTVGENISAGQTILTISNLDAGWIAANIDEDKAGSIKVGQKAEATVDNYPGVVFHGVVTEVGDASQAVFSLIPTENTSGNYTKVTQRLPVKIKVQNQGCVLKPGLSATVKIHLK